MLSPSVELVGGLLLIHTWEPAVSRESLKMQWLLCWVGERILAQLRT